MILAAMWLGSALCLWLGFHAPPTETARAAEDQRDGDGNREPDG